MEKINLVELLKYYPKDAELNCVMYDNVYFDKICNDEGCPYPIKCYILENGIRNSINFTKHGEFTTTKTAKCVIFPKGKTTWEEFVPHCKFKNGDVIYVKDKYNKNWCSILNNCKNNNLYTYVDICIDSNNFYNDSLRLLCNCKDMIEYRLATKEEKEKLFKAIKDNGYKWDTKTKTLKKLSKSYEEETANKAVFDCNAQCCDIMNSLIKNEVSSKFDIATLIPFESKVLVRDGDREKWCPATWGFYNDSSMNYPYECIGGTFAQCIPYESNEHLLGTDNECNEYYKTWK